MQPESSIHQAERGSRETPPAAVWIKVEAVTHAKTDCSRMPARGSAQMVTTGEAIRKGNEAFCHRGNDCHTSTLLLRRTTTPKKIPVPANTKACLEKPSSTVVLTAATRLAAAPDDPRNRIDACRLGENVDRSSSPQSGGRYHGKS